MAEAGVAEARAAVGLCIFLHSNGIPLCHINLERMLIRALQRTDLTLCQKPVLSSATSGPGKSCHKGPKVLLSVSGVVA